MVGSSSVPRPITSASPELRRVAATDRRIRVPAELRHLEEVRAFIRTCALESSAPETCVDDLVQAVDEAATNVIVHGYAGREGWLDVAVSPEPGQLVVTLQDEAPAFDPTAVPEPDLTVPPERRRPGGMGIHLIRLATDGFAHGPRPGGGNILTLERTLDPRAKEDR